MNYTSIPLKLTLRNLTESPISFPSRQGVLANSTQEINFTIIPEVKRLQLYSAILQAVDGNLIEIVQ
jgi:hypothetical protein